MIGSCVFLHTPVFLFIFADANWDLCVSIDNTQMFKPTFFPSPERQTGDLLGGDFFACGYSSGTQEWVGYNLY